MAHSGQLHLEHQERVHGRYEQLVARAWADPALKQRLLVDPSAVFQQEGIEVPKGVEVKVIENTPETWHFVLPGKPETLEELSDEQLTHVVGGARAVCDCNSCC